MNRNRLFLVEYHPVKSMKNSFIDSQSKER